MQLSKCVSSTCENKEYCYRINCKDIQEQKGIDFSSKCNKDNGYVLMIKNINYLNKPEVRERSKLV